MKSEKLWNTVNTSLSSPGEEMQTKTGRWFRLFPYEERVYIDKAIEHKPSSEL